MDTIILAAGRGRRLQGIAAPFFKPFTVVNGRPLIIGSINEADQIGGRIIIVASPSNIVPMIDLVEAVNEDLVSEIRWQVQPRPIGSGDALELGLELADSHRVLVLMSDNILDSEQLNKCVNDNRDGVTIGVDVIEDTDTAGRFTVIDPDLVTHENVGPPEDAWRWSDGLFRVWLGPLVIPRESALNALDQARAHYLPNHELPIGPLLNEFAGDIRLVHGSTIDVGDPVTMERL